MLNNPKAIFVMLFLLSISCSEPSVQAVNTKRHCDYTNFSSSLTMRKIYSEPSAQERNQQILSCAIMPIIQGTKRGVPIFISISPRIFDQTSPSPWRDPDPTLLRILQSTADVYPLSKNTRSMRTKSRCYVDVGFEPGRVVDGMQIVDIDYLSVYVAPHGEEQLGGFKKSYYLSNKHGKWEIVKGVDAGPQIMT